MPLAPTPPPHQHKAMSITIIMGWVMGAAAPGVILWIAYFGWGCLFNLLWTIVGCVAAEAIMLRLRNKPIRRTLFDGSALITGLLLGLALPPFAPWWLSVLGALFAIVVAKQLYGGLGYNIFNPAMAGYVFLMLSFPHLMTAWTAPLPLIPQPLDFGDTLWLNLTGHTWQGQTFDQLRVTLDGFSSATPLDTLKTQLGLKLTRAEIIQKPIYGALSGVGWEWINVAFLIGGLVLVYKKIVDWRIPLSLLTTLFAWALLFYIVDPDNYGTPVFHLFSGASMLGAFFIASDPISAATTQRGRVIYGLGIGTLLYFIRTFGGYPDAIAFSVLLMNIAVPLIDSFTKPRAYGHSV